MQQLATTVSMTPLVELLGTSLAAIQLVLGHIKPLRDGPILATSLIIAVMTLQLTTSQLTVHLITMQLLVLTVSTAAVTVILFIAWLTTVCPTTVTVVPSSATISNTVVSLHPTQVCWPLAIAALFSLVYTHLLIP